MKNHNIIAEYLKLEEEYKNKYEKYLIFLQVGSFYELYSIIVDDERLKKICELMNIILTRKNKSITKISKSNPWMAGVPCVSIDKYLEILINNGYTVIVYNQYIEKNKIKRKLDKIYSIGTYTESENNLNSNISNYIVSIYLEILNDNIITGLSFVDVNIGEIYTLEIYNNDLIKLIEDIKKQFIIYNPKEIILSFNNTKTEKITKFLDYLKNENIILHIQDINDYDNIFKLDFQNEFYENVFKKTIKQNNLSMIENLNLEKYENIRVSLIRLLQFLYQYDNTIINNIDKPNIIINDEILNLHNNALYQLNIFSMNVKYDYQNNYQTNYKFNSLYDVLNKTSTLLGSRFLKKNLSEPITDINELENRYNLISKLIENKKYNTFEKLLDNVLDIEKYHNKLQIGKLQPYQFARLSDTYKSCSSLIKLSKSIFKNFDYKLLNTFDDYYSEFNNYFNIDNLSTYKIQKGFNSITESISCSIFNTGINSTIDEYNNNITNLYSELNDYSKFLSSLINNDKIDIKYTDRDGYFLTLTKIRAGKLKKAVDEYNKQFNKQNNSDKILKLEITNKTISNSYITSKFINDISKKIILNTDKLNESIKIVYSEICNSLSIKYFKLFKYLNYFISYIDFIKSNSKCSDLYNYSKPEIVESNKSFINVKSIRHPISERLHTDTDFITNDIDLNITHNGCLLYGSNGVGKSTLMKSVGLNIIMAQIGCFVSSSSFQFSPYTNLFTRIDHSDNLFKGLSSFESEILELKTILNFSNSNSLVLGDEILNSTENISALSIITSSIHYFINNSISFIFASHLHQIPDLVNPDIKDKLLVCHLTMDYDKNTKSFIYTRKLHKGPSMKNYGLIVANSLLDNKFIIDNSFIIQNKILNNNNIMLKSSDNLIKQSKYNSNVFMTSCYICTDLNIHLDNNSILETHHITFQHTFDNNGLTSKCSISDKAHIKKNQKSNLVNLCKLHHIQVHNHNIIINGWIKSTNGRFLDYNIVKS